jgi:hypothetical protein
MTERVEPGANEFLRKLIDGEITPVSQVEADVEHGFVVPSSLGLGDSKDVTTKPEYSIDVQEQDALMAFALGYHCGASSFHLDTQVSHGNTLNDIEVPDAPLVDDEIEDIPPADDE